MKLTNAANLPEPLVAAVSATEAKYSRGAAEFSITELIGPARIHALRARHQNEIERDASDLIWSLFGTAIHEVLRRGASGNVLSEERLSMKVGDAVISGGIDFYDEASATVCDYKSCSTFAVKDGPKDEWVAQLNGYAMLLRAHGFKVERLRIEALLKDWHAAEAKRNPDYPPVCWAGLDIPLWTAGKCQAFYIERIAAHRAARAATPEGMAVCTDEERWVKPTVYAVMKEGRKSAVKLHESQAEAEAHAAELGKGHSVVHRPGESTRCASYCDVSRFCGWWQTFKGTGA